MTRARPHRHTRTHTHVFPDHPIVSLRGCGQPLAYRSHHSEGSSLDVVRRCFQRAEKVLHIYITATTKGTTSSRSKIRGCFFFPSSISNRFGHIIADEIPPRLCRWRLLRSLSKKKKQTKTDRYTLLARVSALPSRSSFTVTSSAGGPSHTYTHTYTHAKTGPESPA